MKSATIFFAASAFVLAPAARADVAAKIDVNRTRQGNELHVKVKSKDSAATRPQTNEAGLAPYLFTFSLTKTQDIDCDTLFNELDAALFDDMPMGVNLE